MIDLINEYLTWARRAGHSETTIEDRRELFRRIDRELPYGLVRASSEEIAGWLDRDGWSTGTKATYDKALRGIFRWATDARDQWLDFNPMDLVPRRRPPKGVARPVADDVLARILREAEQPYWLWALIAAYQGLRCCEISGLDREHVTDTTLFVVRGKGGAPRWHDTDPDVWAAVRDLSPGPIARLRCGRRASAKVISSTTGEYFRAMGLPGVTLHRLRHWLGVTVQRNYRDPRVTQSVLGHASLSSAQIYTDATDEQQRAARATLPRFDLRHDAA